MHVSIEAAVDICSHIISVEKLRKPERYADVPSILKEARVLGQDVANSLVDMIRFRNILVHLYAKLDAEKLYDILWNNLDDFDRFEGEIVRYVKHTEQFQRGKQ